MSELQGKLRDAEAATAAANREAEALRQAMSEAAAGFAKEKEQAELATAAVVRTYRKMYEEARAQKEAPKEAQSSKDPQSQAKGEQEGGNLEATTPAVPKPSSPVDQFSLPSFFGSVAAFKGPAPVEPEPSAKRPRSSSPAPQEVGLRSPIRRTPKCSEAGRRWREGRATGAGQRRTARRSSSKVATQGMTSGLWRSFWASPTVRVPLCLSILFSRCLTKQASELAWLCLGF